MSELEAYIFDRCLNYLSFRARSEKEITDYINNILRKRSVADEFKLELIESITDRLNKLNLLDDVAFAKAVVNQRTNSKNPKGPLAIQAELFKKGISREVIHSVIPPIPQTTQIAQKVAAQKFPIFKKKDPKSARQKTLRYLIGRGFSFDCAISAIDTATHNK